MGKLKCEDYIFASGRDYDKKCTCSEGPKFNNLVVELLGWGTCSNDACNFFKKQGIRGRTQSEMSNSEKMLLYPNYKMGQ